MRDIIFRGKSVMDGEWVYGYYWKSPDKTNYIRAITDRSTDYLVHPPTVGQFTGLTDKNGKEIYEGDICSIKGKFKAILPSLDFHGDEFEFEEVDTTDTVDDIRLVFGQFRVGNAIEGGLLVEVIGNIHEE